MRRAGLLLMSVVVVALVVPATAALAHGDLAGTSPEDGDRVGRPPAEVRITLTEAPTRGAEARATDGCKKKVPSAVSVDGDDILLTLEGGEPGRWKVSYRAVSSVDGHRTRGNFGFTVTGNKDCRGDASEGPADDIDPPPGPGLVAPEEESSVSWLLWVGLGTIGLAAVAWLIRRSSQ